MVGVSIANSNVAPRPVPRAWGRRILWCVLILLVIFLVLNGRTVWERITLKRIPDTIENYFAVEGRLYARRGWHSVKRWGAASGLRHGKAG